MVSVGGAALSVLTAASWYSFSPSGTTPAYVGMRSWYSTFWSAVREGDKGSGCVCVRKCKGSKVCIHICKHP